VAAFRATLEEVAESDVLVHVIDVSSDAWEKREQSVLDTLEEINAGGKPVVRVLNKIDAVPYTENGNSGRLRAEAMMLGTGEDTVAVSAKTGEGAEDFVECLRKALQGLLKDIEVVIPYSKGEDVNAINEVGVVDKVDYRENGTYIRGKVPPALFNSLAKWAVDESSS
jgi:GTP-binding protein HflX